jgi:hypothetical protein
MDVRKFVVKEERKTFGAAGVEGGGVPPAAEAAPTAEAAMEVDVGA